jgi:acetyl-CoA carboxylase carboxyltransferase component
VGRRPNDLQGLAELSGLVPLVALVLGPSAGHGALTAPLCDVVVMTGDAALFSGGPPLVKDAIGEDVTKEELGGPQVHVDVSGVAHNVVADDGDAVAFARRYLAFFPSSAWTRAPWHDTGDIGPRSVGALLDLIPPDERRAYSMRAVLDLVADRDSVLEIQPRYGAAMVTALARLGGHSVAIVANDPAVRAGAIDSAAAAKAAHFLEVADSFHLPVVFLADNPGVMVGTRAEREGALRHAARLFAVQHRLRVPKLHVTVRKAYGFGSSVMAMNPFDGQTISLALPGVTLGAMPGAEGDAYRRAETLAYDDVIDPRELRNALLAGLRLAAGRDAVAPTPATWTGITP